MGGGSFVFLHTYDKFLGIKVASYSAAQRVIYAPLPPLVTLVPRNFSLMQFFIFIFYFIFYYH